MLLLKGPPPEHMRKSLRFTSTITHERGTYERTRKSKTRYCLVKSGLTGRTSDCYTDCAAHFIAPLAKSSSGYWSDNEELEKVIASALSRNLDPAYLDGLYRAQKGLAGYDDGNLEVLQRAYPICHLF